VLPAGIPVSVLCLRHGLAESLKVCQGGTLLVWHQTREWLSGGGTGQNGHGGGRGRGRGRCGWAGSIYMDSPCLVPDQRMAFEGGMGPYLKIDAFHLKTQPLGSHGGFHGWFLGSHPVWYQTRRPSFPLLLNFLH
jgi:hypothetical protein